MKFQHTPHEGTSLQNSLSGRTVFSICVTQKYRILFAADDVFELGGCSPKTRMLGYVSGLNFF